jgi:putative transcriptional regulator
MAKSRGFALPSTKGRILVAAPPLNDPNFDRTVIYMLEHSEGGALGLVLNRPSDDLDIEFDLWDSLVTPPNELFCGGPVDPKALIGLGVVPGKTPDGQTFVSIDCVSPVDLDGDPTTIDPRPTMVRIFHGYAGWGPQQLDVELEGGAWLVLNALVTDVFTDQPEELWQAVLRRQKGEVSWLADCPADPMQN